MTRDGLPSGFSQPKQSPKAVVYLMSLEEVRDIAKAAELTQESISGFFRSAALERASTVLQGHPDANTGHSSDD